MLLNFLFQTTFVVDEVSNIIKEVTCFVNRDRSEVSVKLVYIGERLSSVS